MLLTSFEHIPDIPLEQRRWFRMLDDAQLQALDTINTLYRDAAVLFATELTVKARRDLQRDIKNKMAENDFRGVKEAMATARRDLRDERAYRWYREQRDCLSREQFWQELASNQMSFEEVVSSEALEKNWWKNAAFAHYTSAALSFVADAIVPVAQQYINCAKLEFRLHKRQLSQGLRDQYRRYLMALEAQLQHVRQDICDAMLGRLSVSSQRQDVYYDDVTMATIDGLNELGVLKQNGALTHSPRRSLSVAYFNQFHRYLQQRGNDSQQRQLASLTWFTEDECFRPIHRGGVSMMVPRNVSDNLLPKRNTWFPTLFKAKAFRWRFFQDHRWLMASVRMLTCWQPQQQSLADYNQHLANIERQLLLANQAANQWEFQGVKNVFYYKTQKFVRGWQIFSQSVQDDLLEKKLTALEHMIQESQLAQMNSADADDVEHLLAQVQQSVEVDGIQQALQQRFEHVQSRFALWRADHDEVDVEPLVITTEEQLQIALSEQRLSQEHQQRLQDNRPRASFDQLSLLHKLSIYELSDSNFHTILHAGFQEAEAIRREGNAGKIRELRQLLLPVFYAYLQACEQCDAMCDFDQLTDKHTSIEKLLLCYAAGHVRRRVKSLVQMREKTVSWYPVKIKCRSLLHGYGEGGKLIESTLSLFSRQKTSFIHVPVLVEPLLVNGQGERQ